MTNQLRPRFQPAQCFTAPGVVRNLKLINFSPRDETATVMWDPPHHNTLHFIIKWWINGGKEHLVTSEVEAFTLKDLQPGCSYNIQVAAVAQQNSELLSSSFAQVLNFNTAPKAPYGIQVFPGLKSPTTSLTVRFNDKGCSGKRYLITVRSLVDGQSKKEETDCLLVTVGGLMPGCSYLVYVVSVKDGVESEQKSSEDIVMTYPGKVERLQVISVTATSMTISWDPVFGASSYIVKHRRKDKNFKEKETQDTELTLEDLDKGYKYRICVAAVNSSGTGSFTQMENAVTDLVPPSDLTATSGLSSDGVFINIEFRHSSQQPESEYWVELVAQSDSTEIQPKIVKTTGARFDHLSYGTCYIPNVCALGKNHVKSVKIHGKAIWTGPSQVKDVKSKFISCNSEAICWQKVNGATSYLVKCQEDGKQPGPDSETTNTEINLANLSLGASFTVWVAAKNEGGVGAFSFPILFQTALSAPSSVTATITDHGILVTWGLCPGAKQYNVNLFGTETWEIVTTSQTPVNQCCFKISELLPAREYRAGVQAVADSENRSSTFEHSEPFWTYCSQVQEIKCEQMKRATFEIKWDEVQGAQEYKVICKTSDGRSNEHTTKTNKLTLSNLELGESYKIAVCPRNKAGYSKESDAVSFDTAMQPPSNIRIITNKASPCSSVTIKFDEPEKKPSKYRVWAYSASHKEKTITERNHCLLRNLRPGTEYVVCVCSIDQINEKRDSEVVESNHFRTAPPKVTDVILGKDSLTSRYMKWTTLPAASSYVVKQKQDGREPIFHEVERNEIHLGDLSLQSKYSLTVSGKNEGGNGDESDEIFFETALFAPKRVEVSNNTRNPTTSIDVHFEEPEVSCRKYRIRVICSQEDRNLIKIVNQHEAMSATMIPDLTAGQSYQVAVSSVHDSDESLNSKEILSNVIQTSMSALVAKCEKLSNSRYKITWEEKVDATSYKVFWRIEHENWQEEEVTTSEYVLNDLEPGRNFEVKVAAYSSAGQGKGSKPIMFTTVPASPTGLKKKIISTRTIEITCDDTTGASTYVFYVSGQPHEKNEPKLHLQHDGENTIFKVKVAAKNKAGTSPASPELTFTQVLLHLQKKFYKLAAHKFAEENFVRPAFIEVPSNDEVEDFGTKDFSIRNGETVLVVGEHFTGKTSCCCQYLQHLLEDKLGFFLDWNEFKKLQHKMDVKAVLKRCMSDIMDDEITFVLGWMKDNSDKVVLVIDNFALPTTFIGRPISPDGNTTVQNIFHSFVDPKREIFPESQVLCATSQSHMQQIVNPQRCLNIIGFDATQIDQMKKGLFGTECNLEIPKHLEYFCKNPSYCKIILQLLKDPEPCIDLESYSSVLIKVFTQSLNMYPGVTKKEKLLQILQDIKNVPHELSTEKPDPNKPLKTSEPRSDVSSSITKCQSVVTSSTGGYAFSRYVKGSCGLLHDFIVKAFYFAYFCSAEYFKKRFHKKAIILGQNSKIWILTAGLLREETRMFTAKLFDEAGETLNVTETNKKLKFATDFVTDNLSNIKKQLTVEPQVVLDWYDVANEINDKRLLKQCAFEVDVDDSMENQQIEEIAYFFRNMRRNLCPFVNLKLPKEKEHQLQPIKQTALDRSKRENPYYEEIAANKPGTAGKSKEWMANFPSNPSYRVNPKSEELGKLENRGDERSDLSTNPVCSPISSDNDSADKSSVAQSTSSTSTGCEESIRLGIRQESGNIASLKTEDDDDYSALHGEECVTESAQGTVQFAQAASISPNCFEQLHTTHMAICNAFKFPDDSNFNGENSKVMTRTFCTTKREGIEAHLLKADENGWIQSGTVKLRNFQRIRCTVVENKTYILAKRLSEDMSHLLFHLVCRTTVDQFNTLKVILSIDDGLSRFMKSKHSSVEQRFTMRMKGTMEVKITTGTEVLSEWSYTLAPRPVRMEKSVVLDKDKIKSDIFCYIRKGGAPISQWRVPTVPTGIETDVETQTVSPFLAHALTENALYAELSASWKPKGVLNYVAKSLSSGKEISATFNETSAVLRGIDPGDKYSVTVYEMVEGSPDLLIAKAEIQTSKTIGQKGGIVVVGGCTLKFPVRAVRSQAAIEVCTNLKDAPCVPNDRFCITPVFDFQSTQKKFDEYVTCTLTTPYIKVEEPIEVEILYYCYEDHEWHKVCTSLLTKEGTVEFKCDHFSPYAAVINKSFAAICALNMKFLMENRIYYDKSQNFAGVTCLDEPSIVEKWDRELHDSGYFRSPFRLSTICMKVGETVKYFMRSTRPIAEIDQWEVTLNEDFVVKKWCKEKTFSVDKPDEGTTCIKLSLQRIHGSAEESFSVQITFPITPPTSPVTNITAMYLVQGGEAHFTQEGIQATVTSHLP